MNPKVIQHPAFTVIGIAGRTSNEKEMSGEPAVIGPFWRRFMSESLLAQIPNRADQSIVAVYTDYASDKDGEYAFVLGARVMSDATVPAGMVVKKIPAGRYALFTSEKGPGVKVVPELWMNIYQTPRAAMGGERAYDADFEIYDQRAANPENLVMDAYIGIK